MVPSFSKRSLLFVNPWIHDFAAYDLWMKPLGLLYLGGILRSKGFAVSLLDCLDFSFFPEDLTSGLKTPKRKESGRGHFYREVIPKPYALRQIPRQYRRYGIPPDVAKKYLLRIRPPDLILVTSSLTYWYPGVFETIDFLRRSIPGVPILLGGPYTTLCPSHAQRYSGADQVLPGPWNGEKMRTVATLLGEERKIEDESFSSWPFPAFDLYPQLRYICLLTRCGCPFSCTYCASSKLARGFESRQPEKVLQEIIHWSEKLGVRNFAFYDDALLLNPSSHLFPLLQEVIRRPLTCNFHAPNALHVKAIDQEVADLLFRSGFKTIRLGLETSNEILQFETGGKVDNQEFRRAVRSLKKAGYAGEEIGVYLLAGLPGQRIGEVKESVSFVRKEGAKPILVEYSPIPGTPLFEKAKEVSPFDIENEPLFQNNSILPCQWEGLTWADFRKLKETLREQP